MGSYFAELWLFARADAVVVDCVFCGDGDSRRFFPLRNFAWDCLSGRISE